MATLREKAESFIREMGSGKHSDWFRELGNDMLRDVAATDWSKADLDTIYACMKIRRIREALPPEIVETHRGRYVLGDYSASDMLGVHLERLESGD